MTRFVQSAPAWVAQYIGIPFKAYGRDLDGCDCWGLVRLVARDQFSFALPFYEGRSWEPGTDGATLAAFMEIERARQGTWTEIARGTEDAGDCILMLGGRRRADPIHVGIIPAFGWVLHTEAGINAALDRYHEMRIKHAIVGFYRHASRAA